MIFLLDTNILSELVRPRPSSAVLAWLGARGDDCFRISVVTLAELRYGIDRLGESERRLSLDRWYRQDVLAAFAGRIMEIDLPVLVEARHIIDRLKLAGLTVSYADLLIAATARRHGLVLATRNVRDFEATGVTLANPWQGTADTPP
ncbi:type II toxin-antitoxin system VapC family toxin [Rhodospirillum centenum]|uniref:Ribonuclease VapC n=1 Tax=Rhodospirillum centenum (strain ATCC 51521 / SW) TaxID=414684 RepID=B6IXB1_RHOCS|nr:type II toxin-antitoxin system VapC family toxin [Rhodospirillum centenum]ACJ00935.1 plasmid stability protein StbB, putative [Rhodospirillum centenum SW]